jgi:hypothetical protein
MTYYHIIAIHGARRRLSKWNARTNLDRSSWEYSKKIRELNAELQRLRDEAAKAFAQLNGWVACPPHGSHTIHFRAPGRSRKNIAAVVQRYHYYGQPIATREGVQLPPDPFASFHFPGWTSFEVHAPPGFEVKFLPEQDGRFIGLWVRPRLIGRYNEEEETAATR